MTYSIVARDATNGDLGVAVQSHYFSVGSIVTWAEAGVGVVATQAFAEASYGPLGLDLMRGGKAAGDALRALLTADEEADRRQVAMVDASGHGGVHTGNRCIAEAGHRTGDGYSCQANMMLRNTVPDAMASAFEATSGPLADRLLAALDAAEAEGGDIRGKQSAAMLVVRGERAPNTHAGRVLELRVEDHAEPLDELRRLVGVQRAYAGLAEAQQHLDAGAIGQAREVFERAQRGLGHNPEPSFWAGLRLAATGEVGEAQRFLTRAYEDGDHWRELLRRLPAAGLFPADADLLKRLGA